MKWSNKAFLCGQSLHELVYSPHGRLAKETAHGDTDCFSKWCSDALMHLGYVFNSCSERWMFTASSNCFDFMLLYAAPWICNDPLYHYCTCRKHADVLSWLHAIFQWAQTYLSVQGPCMFLVHAMERLCLDCLTSKCILNPLVQQKVMLSQLI